MEVLASQDAAMAQNLVTKFGEAMQGADMSGVGAGTASQVQGLGAALDALKSRPDNKDRPTPGASNGRAY
jgi:hypothetical protein